MSKSEETIQVPIAWLKRLVQLGKETDVYLHTGVPSLGVQPFINKTYLVQLKGFIESAETLLIGEIDDEEEGNEVV